MACKDKLRNIPYQKEVRQAEQNGWCEFNQEYDADEFLPPARNEPVIESIHFVTGDKMEDILTAYKK